MPPKPKYTKDEITSAAFELLREQGDSALTSRELGVRLGTSTRPIFTAFANMEELKAAVLDQCWRLFHRYREREMRDPTIPSYKTFGLAYIRLAAMEKNVFRFLFMRNTTKEAKPEPANSEYAKMISTVQVQTGLDAEKAERFHLEMWIWVHGVATMLATSYLELDFATISRMMTDVYEGLKVRYCGK